MYHPYLFQIVMREREREILEEMGRGDRQSRRRRGGSGLSKKIAGRLRSALSRIKTIVAPKRSRQPIADEQRGYESWQKEFS